MTALPDLSIEFVQALLPFIAVGFLAQLVDGALGMAFGLITNLMLVGMVGLAPARASANVHLVECFTTAASAISHIIYRNVDWGLLARLAIPGMIGGAAGAYVLSNIDASLARPFVMAYLAGIGVYLLWRAWRLDHGPPRRAPRLVPPLGLVGGFLDAAGGGGWGPIVTSNLLIQGASPRTRRAALMPATMPWAPASSYPVVPLIWPAKNRPSMTLVSSDPCRSRGSK